MRYYQIVTSELEIYDRDIIDKYHGLTRIEDQFREVKGTLNNRPIYVNTPEHIQAHLLICFIALTMMRTIQHKVKLSFPSDADKSLFWTYGISGPRLSRALLDWKVKQLSDVYYRMSCVNSDNLRLILKVFGLHIPPTLFTSGDLRALNASVSAF